jgi:hypothetical protein
MDKQKEKMTKKSGVDFLLGVTHEKVEEDDRRITAIF